MVYEKGHKKVLGIWFDLVLRVKYSTIPIFKVTLRGRSMTMWTRRGGRWSKKRHFCPRSASKMSTWRYVVVKKGQNFVHVVIECQLSSITLLYSKNFQTNISKK